jgi:uncharacterized protein
MEPSKHNIISKIADSDNYFIVNLLSQEADILNADEAKQFITSSFVKPDDYIEKGYLVDPLNEQKYFRKRYLEFIDKRDTDEIQIFYVPSYACNFNCSYCYQDEYNQPPAHFNKDILKAFFQFIDIKFSDRRKYITVFGGEPLLNNASQKEFFTHFIAETKIRQLDVAVVTNGYYLEEYIDILKNGNIREIQVTLDGTEKIHNNRRMLKGGGTSFLKIVRGIDLALASKINVNLRMVLDKDNIDDLPNLARFAMEKEWTKSGFFKTQLGRNYELHHCQGAASKLYSRIDLYTDIYKILKENPEIADFHKPAFSISKYLFEEGHLPDPLFDSCPGTKTEWAFDFMGKVYACTATVGKSGEELGTFFPVQMLDDKRINEWQNRDILSIEKCSSCTLQLACGGGCAAIAKNTSGSINSADCRPVKDLIGLGIGYYFRQEVQ